MLLELKDITKSFAKDDSWFFKRYQDVLKGVSLSLNEGECIGIVGESGSGKSTLGKVILGLETQDSGSVTFSQECSQLPRHKAVSVVFQDYNTSVNPRLNIAQIIAEPLINEGLEKSQLKAQISKLLIEVGLEDSMRARYPHQLSGGQLQRVCIARAIAANPRFILLDEAVSSLDVSIQVQILDLLLELKQSRNIAYLFITHDIAVASYLCDRLMFFKDGKIVEQVNNITALPLVTNEYTKNLLNAASYLEIPFDINDVDK
ncbi:ABC transporter ATP-binding protein [Agarivorans sp. DSG3-1]|uniref:ABC transporter ATP-binding protein n=1 Tax=Agarivorans sp. DSG3-1 TaxID=3342249 RepID=UPI00398E7948